MYCIHCGRKLPEDGSVCACGNLQPGQNVPAEPQAAAPVEAPAPVISAAQPAEQPAVAEPPAEPQAAAPVEAPAPVISAAQPAEQPAVAEPPAEPQAAAPVEAPAPVISAAQPAQAPAYAQQPAPYGQPYTDTYQPQNPYAQPYVQNPYAPRAAYPYQPAQQARPFAAACAAVKSLAASPLFLIGTIFVSLGFLLSLISAFIPVNYARLFSMLPPEVYYALDFSDLQYQLYMLQDGSVLTAFLFQLPGLILSALAVAGLWMTFASGKSGSSPTLKTSGLTILKVLQVFSVVGYAVLALLLVIFAVVALINAAMVSDYTLSGSVVKTASTILAVILLALLAVIALLIVYSAKVIGSINAAKAAAAGSAMLKKASMFVAVLGFLMAGYALIDLYGTVVFSGWLAALRNACTAGAQIVFGICIIQFNKRVASLRTPSAM